MTHYNLKEKEERFRDFCAMDDEFFSLLAKDNEVCEEILRTILEDPGLTVISSTIQSTEQNPFGKSIRLDVKCELSTGVLCDIEVQKTNSEDHLRRTRFTSSVLTTRSLGSGEKYVEVKDVYVVYISAFDHLGENKTIYHLDHILRETGTVVDNGDHIIFVNTVIKDGSDISELMTCFTQKEVNNPKFPKLSNAVYRLKHNEEGKGQMSDIVREIVEEAVAEAVAEAVEETRTNDSIEYLRAMMKKLNISLDSAMDILNLSKEERQIILERI